MKTIATAPVLALIVASAFAAAPARAQTQSPVPSAARDGNFHLALPSHNGQLLWHADGFKVVKMTAKPAGAELGVRAADASGGVSLFAFLFLFPDDPELTSAKCRDATMEAAAQGNKTLKILGTSSLARFGGPPVALVNYTAQTRDGKSHFSARAFVASPGICGDLQAYSDSPVSASDPAIRKIFATYRLDPNYVPQATDLLLSGQALSDNQLYGDAAPLFEQAASKLGSPPSGDKKAGDKNQEALRRFAIERAGMAYGVSGDTAKARAIFQAAIAKDPNYPLFYYDLARADAADNKLADARTHLEQAFAHKSGMPAGQKLPDPSLDDSFRGYQSNKQFWSFIQTLH